MNWKKSQTKEAIFSELLLAPHRFQIAVCRGNQTRIRSKGARASQPLELPLLQHAEQFGLQFKRNFSYFVQENRAAILHFETPNPFRNPSSKRPFYFPPQFTFQHPRPNG